MGFSLYPKRIFGGMSLMVKFCTESMVFCRVNPTASIRRETRLHHSKGSDGKNYKGALLAVASALEENPNAMAERNRFCQIGTPVSLYGKITLTVDGSTPPAFAKIEVTNTLANFAAPTIEVVSCKSFLYGFKIKKELVEHLTSYFQSNPFCVPSQVMRSYSFPNPPSIRGLDTQINIPLIHCVEAIVVFPHFHNDVTCFLNPQYKDLCLKFLDQSFPDTGVDTTSDAFFRSQLEANQLGTLLQCTQAFENSYQIKYSGVTGERYFTPTDVTDFAFSVPVDIPNTNSLLSDGANSRQNTVISLTGNAIEQKETDKVAEGVYYNVEEDPTTGKETTPNVTAPILILISNAFWCFSVAPNSDTPHCTYETNKSFSEFCEQYFPSALAA
jgi:hypothetical protein